jgi:CBS domain-containing protein
LDASEIMTDVVATVSPRATLAEVGRALAYHAVSDIPVCEADGTLVGIISIYNLVLPVAKRRKRRRDDGWLRQLIGGTHFAQEYFGGIKWDQTTARDVMRADVIAVTETTPVAEVVEVMITRDIKSVPIVRDGKLVGIVTRLDLMKTTVRRPEVPLSASA